MAQKEDPDLHEVRKWAKTSQISIKESLQGKGEELIRYREVAGAIKMDSRGVLVLPMNTPGTDQKVNRILVTPVLRASSILDDSCPPYIGTLWSEGYHAESTQVSLLPMIVQGHPTEDSRV